MNTLETQKVGALVADDFRTAEIFRKYKIDFCCGGGVSIAEACKKKAIPLEKVLQELTEIRREMNTSENYNAWSLHLLADYIVQTHHEYVKNKLPEISFYANKVAHVHGANHPELHQLFALFSEIHAEMIDHMKKEELILFPFIKELENASLNAETMLKKPAFGTVKNPVAMMIAEHESAGGIMEEIQKISNNFTPPVDACTTYRVYFQNLSAFQNDLHKHVHLENNILFPKALQLEETYLV